MGEYVKVICKECKQELDEVWVEELEKHISIEIDSPACKCIDELLDGSWHDGRANEND